MLPTRPKPKIEDEKNPELSVKAKQELAKFKAGEFLGGFGPVSVMNNPLLFWNSQHARKEYPELRIVACEYSPFLLNKFIASASLALLDSKSTKLTRKHTNEKLVYDSWVRKDLQILCMIGEFSLTVKSHTNATDRKSAAKCCRLSAALFCTIY